MTSQFTVRQAADMKCDVPAEASSHFRILFFFGSLISVQLLFCCSVRRSLHESYPTCANLKKALGDAILGSASDSCFRKMKAHPGRRSPSETPLRVSSRSRRHLTVPPAPHEYGRFHCIVVAFHQQRGVACSWVPCARGFCCSSFFVCTRKTLLSELEIAD